MRKLWVKAWITLDGVFDADTMDHSLVAKYEHP